MTEPASPTPALRLEFDGALAWIVADNSRRMNAFTQAMWADLPRAVAEATAAEQVRVIVLRGAGERAFSAGADISEFDTARSGDSVREYDRISDAAFQALAHASKPTIAMIHGFCLGGGLGLAASCDLRLASETATFAIPAAKLGIGYDPRWVATLLAILTPPRVKEILFTGRRLEAEEAARIGLVNRVVPADRLEEETRGLALEIAGNAPLTVRAAKLSVDGLWRHPGTSGTNALDEAVTACFQSEDYAEGRKAFLEKRAPIFRGR